MSNAPTTPKKNKDMRQATAKGAAHFAAELDKASALTQQAEEIKKAARQGMADALENIAILAGGAIALPRPVELELAEDASEDKEPSGLDGYGLWIDASGLRYSDDECQAEALEQGWEDAEGEEELQDYAHSIYKLSDYHMLALLKAASSAASGR